ncbi:hypothetical protein F383_23271 [Gossypium arboreum]|uniref:Uncharacterized protein n=1 Tax=Gossypium arboreum TaxID=29729 RepID=A0A0B0NW53_GOSAR|nr:hypothetical protein F383_23271 [Gossypium arboreum]
MCHSKWPHTPVC